MTEGQKLITNKDFFKITESDYFILGACWESMFLIDKINYNEIHLGDFDGVVDIGVISKDNSWIITGGEVIFLWRIGIVTTIDKDELKCVEGIRPIGDNLVELKIDTLNLNNHRSTWTLDTETLELKKLY
jgi:hypothetical protein